MSDVPSFITIRGYAAPFNRPMHVAGRGVEVIDRGAFDHMLNKRGKIRVTWDSHADDAEVLAHDAELFVDGYGLAFSCQVDMRSAGNGRRNWSIIRAITTCNNPADQCSVGGLAIAAERSDVVDGMPCTRVVQASIDHITICRDAAYGRFTACWPTHLPIEDAPWRVQELAAQWQAGKAAAGLEAKRRRLLTEAEHLIRSADRTDRDMSDGELAAFNAKLAAVRALDLELGR